MGVKWRKLFKSARSILLAEIRSSIAGRALAISAIGIALFHSTPAAAEFSVCNQTLDVVNVAIGVDVDSEQKTQGYTEGWWTIGANRCVDVIKDELQNRYIYVYATDVFGQPILSAETQGYTMCVQNRKFRIPGIESCWQRGFEAVHFMEVDTQAVERWTLFLKEPGAQ